MVKEFKCMLAHPVGKKEWDKNSYVQPKLDGVRCYITKDGAFSRTHKEWKNIGHILAELKPLFETYPDIILDGELYNHNYKDNFNKIISLVRQSKPTDDQTLIQFHNYDMYDANDPSKSFIDRNSFIKEQHKIHEFDYCYEVTTKIVRTLKQAKENNKIFLKQGYEGSILRNNNKYEQKRSYNLQKLKDFSDTEAVIINWVEGKGKRDGTIGKFIAKDEHGVVFGMPVMAKMSVLKEMYDIVEWYMGKTATFTYFQKTPAGSYRHPLFKCIRNYE